MSISDQIRAAIQARVNAGETIYAVMKATGVDHGVITRFLRGERELRSSTIDRLCGYLGLDLGPIDGHPPGAAPATDAGKHDRAASGPATGKAAANRRGEKKAGRNAAGKPKSATSSSKPAAKSASKSASSTPAKPASSAAPSPPKIADAGEVPKPVKRKPAKRKPGGRQR